MALTDDALRIMDEMTDTLAEITAYCRTLAFSHKVPDKYLMPMSDILDLLLMADFTVGLVEYSEKCSCIAEASFKVSRRTEEFNADMLRNSEIGSWIQPLVAQYAVFLGFTPDWREKAGPLEQESWAVTKRILRYTDTETLGMILEQYKDISGKLLNILSSLEPVLSEPRVYLREIMEQARQRDAQLYRREADRALDRCDKDMPRYYEPADLCDVCDNDICDSEQPGTDSYIRAIDRCAAGFASDAPGYAVWKRAFRLPKELEQCRAELNYLAKETDASRADSIARMICGDS